MEYSIALEFPTVSIVIFFRKAGNLLFCTLAKISDEVILTLWERVLLDHSLITSQKLVFN